MTFIEMQNFLQMLVGKPIKKIWVGYAGVLFLEIGNLHTIKRVATKKTGEKQEYTAEEGEFSFMIQSDWKLRFNNLDFTSQTLQENFIRENIVESITSVNVSPKTNVFSIHFGTNNFVEKRIGITKNKEMSFHDFSGKKWYVLQGNEVLIEKSNEE